MTHKHVSLLVIGLCLFNANYLSLDNLFPSKQFPKIEESTKITQDIGVCSSGLSFNKTELIFQARRNSASSLLFQTHTVTLSNTSATTINISQAGIQGTNASEYNLDVGFTGNLAAGASTNYTITFAPTTPATDPAVDEAALVIEVDGGTSSLSLSLYGLAINSFRGNNEPALQTIVDALGIGIDVGWSNLANGDLDPTPEGDEVAAYYFVKANVGLVTVTPVGRYSPEEPLPYGWFTADNAAVTYNEVGVLMEGTSVTYAQTLYPQNEGSGVGSVSFNPGFNDFGMYVYSPVEFVRYSHTADTLNGSDVHRTRVYPVKDRDGNIVEHSYLITYEDASNGDYQDYMFVIDNVEPFTGSFLPIQLVSFKAEQTDNGTATLNWQTVTEVDNKGFEIQKSLDAINFERIAWVDGSGYSNQLINYQYQDKQFTQSAYYRLVQFDENGSSSTSPTVLVKGEFKVNLDVFPNPIGSEQLNLSLQPYQNETLPYSLIDIYGRTLLEGEEDLDDLSLRLNQHFPQLDPGPYFLKINTHTDTQIKRIIKQ